MFVKRRLNRADNQPTSENDKKQMGLLTGSPILLYAVIRVRITLKVLLYREGNTTLRRC